MNAVVGLLVAIGAVLTYSASGWFYPEEPSKSASSIIEVPRATKFVQQNFDSINQQAIRKHISECLRDSHQYLAMSMYFDQAHVALPGFHKMFKEFSEREMSNAIKLMNYMNLREGPLKLTGVQEPAMENEWQNGESALVYALKMERKANAKLLTIIKLALDKHDPHLKQFVEDNFLDQKVKVIKELGDKITKLERSKLEDPGLGLQFFDNTLLK